MDADFLTFYGIDLRDPDTCLSAESFFARAFRLFAYRGVMRQELQAEVENNTEPQPAHTPPAAPAAPVAARPDSDGTRWVSPSEMQSLFPDLF